MQDARVRWALAAFGLLIFGGSGIALYATRHTGSPPVVITAPAGTPSISPAPNKTSEQGEGQGNEAGPLSLPTPVRSLPFPKGRPGGVPGGLHPTAPRIYVHVAGAVRHPSLYALAPGSRVMQAIKAAGGPAPRADLDAINLAEKVRDGEKVYVPAKQPQAAMIVAPGNAIGHTSVIPTDDTAATPPDAPAPTPAMATGEGTIHGGGGKPDKLKSPTQGKINLNTADSEELQRLPGVGPAMAARILTYRAQAHGFRSVDELQEVRGIGPKKFAKITPFVKLE